MNCWHSGNKEEAEDGWPSGGCSPISHLWMFSQDVFPALRLAQHRTPRGVNMVMACPEDRTLLPTATPAPNRKPQPPGQELKALQWEQPPAHPTPGTTGRLHPSTQKITPVRMKGKCSTDCGASRKSMPGDPECLIPPLPSDCLKNLDLWCHPFHPPAPTPDSSPERRK